MTRAILRSFASLLLFASACNGGNDDIGKPCDNDEQCTDDLVCDFHDGKGTCQEDHGHDSAGATGTTVATTAHADSDHHHTSTSPTEATTHDHTTDDHTTGATTEATTGATTTTSG